MNLISTALSGVWVLEPRVHGDERGNFLESYNRRTLEALGIRRDFVQDNLSRSVRGVLRGIHYQVRRPQAKLVGVANGEVFDVVVDLRRGSPTFGRWIGEALDAEKRRMLFVPEGCGHAFLAVSPSADLFYKCSDYYSPGDERGLAWDDPRVGVAWPLGGLRPLLSARDRDWPPLGEIPAGDLPEGAPA